MKISKVNLNKVKHCLHDNGINMYMQDIDDLLTEGNRDVSIGREYKVNAEINEEEISFNMKVDREVKNIGDKQRIEVRPHCSGMSIHGHNYEFE